MLGMQRLFYCCAKKGEFYLAFLLQNIDTSILKRVARVVQTSKIKFKLPEVVFDQAEVVYDPKYGLDIVSPAEECK